MKKTSAKTLFIFTALALGFSSAAFAEKTICTSGDYEATLDIENGQLTAVAFDNTDWSTSNPSQSVLARGFIDSNLALYDVVDQLFLQSPHFPLSFTLETAVLNGQEGRLHVLNVPGGGLDFNCSK